MMRKALLACGVLSSLLYVAMNVVAPMQWEGDGSTTAQLRLRSPDCSWRVERNPDGTITRMVLRRLPSGFPASRGGVT
jgi:hypothetical protein